MHDIKFILSLIVIYIMGYFTAIPVGATQIEIAKRAFANLTSASLMIVLGSAISDTMYGFIAFFGIAPFLKSETVMSVFWLLASIILFVLGMHTLINYKKTFSVSAQSDIIKNLKVSFVTGFSLAVTNPMMIFWWLAVYQIQKDIGLINGYTALDKVCFLFAGGFGIASYLVTLTFVLKWAKKFLSEKIEKRINIGLGIALLVFGLYFLVRSLRVLI
ncbi:Threonine/homoserine/homoserine lactone efflux protein [Desulfurella multipotens]|uniref:Threonine/homoserine/homoserine lactone efflux protein n=1 Tax=Desulfurella multipotens TaxID=79269 RepID=A0A1G6P870_9BACT|nr:LysE family transporter [Desulfurella multipotens]SDC75617.1 Threonine/homoserine/homoserine lactone efflux protein [Desulfurella multipotens]